MNTDKMPTKSLLKKQEGVSNLHKEKDAYTKTVLLMVLYKIIDEHPEDLNKFKANSNEYMTMIENHFDEGKDYEYSYNTVMESFKKYLEEDISKTSNSGGNRGRKRSSKKRKASKKAKKSRRRKSTRKGRK